MSSMAQDERTQRFLREAEDEVAGLERQVEEKRRELAELEQKLEAARRDLDQQRGIERGRQ